MADGNITVEVSTQAAQAELARLRAALDQKHAEYEDLKACAANNARNLAREARTWSKAAETYAAELERHKPLMQAVEWLLDDGHMNTEHLARLRAAWEAALGPNAELRGRPARGGPAPTHCWASGPEAKGQKR